MNKLFLIGNLSKAPEGGETKSEKTFCKICLAVNRYVDGEKKVDYFNVTVWGVQATNCLKFLEKGSKVAIVGSLQNRTYEDKDGNKRFVTDIIANEVEFLTANNKGESANNEPINEEDLPF